MQRHHQPEGGVAGRRFVGLPDDHRPFGAVPAQAQPRPLGTGQQVGEQARVERRQPRCPLQVGREFALDLAGLGTPGAEPEPAGRGGEGDRPRIGAVGAEERGPADGVPQRPPRHGRAGAPGRGDQRGQIREVPLDQPRAEPGRPGQDPEPAIVGEGHQPRDLGLPQQPCRLGGGARRDEQPAGGTGDGQAHAREPETVGRRQDQPVVAGGEEDRAEGAAQPLRVEIDRRGEVGARRGGEIPGLQGGEGGGRAPAARPDPPAFPLARQAHRGDG